MDLPTPDVVMMEAMYSDVTAEDLIDRLGIREMMYLYRGEPVIQPVRYGKREELIGEGRKIIDWVLIIVNHRIKLDGWKIEQRVFGIQIDLVLDKIKFETPKTTFLDRLKRAWQVLNGQHL